MRKNKLPVPQNLINIDKRVRRNVEELLQMSESLGITTSRPPVTRSSVDDGMKRLNKEEAKLEAEKRQLEKKIQENKKSCDSTIGLEPMCSLDITSRQKLKEINEQLAEIKKEKENWTKGLTDNDLESIGIPKKDLETWPDGHGKFYIDDDGTINLLIRDFNVDDITIGGNILQNKVPTTRTIEIDPNKSLNEQLKDFIPDNEIDKVTNNISNLSKNFDLIKQRDDIFKELGITPNQRSDASVLTNTLLQSTNKSKVAEVLRLSEIIKKNVQDENILTQGFIKTKVEPDFTKFDGSKRLIEIGKNFEKTKQTMKANVEVENTIIDSVSNDTAKKLKRELDSLNAKKSEANRLLERYNNFTEQLEDPIFIDTFKNRKIQQTLKNRDLPSDVK